MVILLIVSLMAVILAFAVIRQDAPEDVPKLQSFPAMVILIIIPLILLFFFWPMYKTYYTLSQEGVHVQYGPWKKLHPWTNFNAAYWRKGMFATRIGWPTITPCVRLTNAVQLSRKKGWFPLYLTPNDPKAFLQKITEFAPDLTRETIL